MNIFIGANNSGKSRFLRELFSTFAMREHSKAREKILSKGIDWSFIESSKIEEMLVNIKIFLDKQTSDSFITSKAFAALKHEISQFIGVRKLIGVNAIKRIYDEIDEVLNSRSFAKPKEEVPDFNPVVKASQKSIQAFLNEEIAKLNLHATYIPVLRGLRRLSQGAENEYRIRTFNDYFPKVNQGEAHLFTGMDLFEIVKKLKLANYPGRQKIQQFEAFLSKNFFNGHTVELIPREHTDSELAESSSQKGQNQDLFVKIGNQKERPIYELGDGVQAIIILTFPLFEHQDKYHLLFVEEPEHFLHPGFQRIFIEAVRSCPNVQLFFTTHSNNFLDLTLEAENSISVYSFKNDQSEELGHEITPSFTIENVSSLSQNVLDLIGVKNSSVFLANCTIWVEGITDRLYIRRFLQLYQEQLPAGMKRFREDIHYAFVEYAGNNITHWSFLDGTSRDTNINVERVCGKLFLITDQDGALQGNKKAKLARHHKLLQALGNRYYCLPCREIENLLSPIVLKKVVQAYEKISDYPFKQTHLHKDYKYEPLGQYLEENVIVKNRKGSYRSPSGTIAGKIDFAHKAISYIESQDELTSDALDLCKRLYAFFEQNNK